MSGFDNGTAQGGVFFQAKQFGSVLRGFGPPVPEAGVVGDLYLDTQTFFLYTKRAAATDPWGHYLFVVPAAYQNTLKWFSAYAPTNDVGVAGDYCLAWSGWSNYGLQPSIYGPMQAAGWPENGFGPGTQIDPVFAGLALPIGLQDEGAAVAYSSSTQLIVEGLLDEYILALPTGAPASAPVNELGLQSSPVNVPVVLNPIYAAEDQHTV